MYPECIWKFRMHSVWVTFTPHSCPFVTQCNFTFVILSSVSGLLLLFLVASSRSPWAYSWNRFRALVFPHRAWDKSCAPKNWRCNLSKPENICSVLISNFTRQYLILLFLSFGKFRSKVSRNPKERGLSTPWLTTASSHGRGRQRPKRIGWLGIDYNNIDSSI